MQHTFINENLIHSIIEAASNPSDRDVTDVLAKAKKLKGLTPEETALLINIQNNSQIELLFNTAFEIKQTIYGNRIVLFAPLYVSNYCSNNCLYCGFRSDNDEILRKRLTIDEVKKETEILLEQGHKRILMLMGEENSGSSLDYFLECIEAVYSVKDSKGNSIRRINIEIAPLSQDEFKKLKQLNIGTYVVFQETYHRETYERIHPGGKKKDYMWRLNVMDRALESGLHDVGIGALFGLYDYRFETLALLTHAMHLEEKFGIGPHTISVPRIEFAKNAPCAENVPCPVSDIDFKKIVAALRCAVPYTGIILSTREEAGMRTELMHLGVSQLSAGSKTDPGGYGRDDHTSSQFSLNDTRSTGEIIASVIDEGFLPSFCTGCYRRGRTGKDFMDLAKPGLIKNHCQPNALLTLKEYLIDYADEKTRVSGNELIKKELESIPDKKRREETEKNLLKTEQGERDIYS